MSNSVICIPAGDRKLLEQIRSNYEFITQNEMGGALDVQEAVPEHLVHTVSPNTTVSELLRYVWLRKIRMEEPSHEPVVDTVAPDCPEGFSLFMVQTSSKVEGDSNIVHLPVDAVVSDIASRDDVLRLGEGASSRTVLLYANDSALGEDAVGIAMLVMCAVSLCCMLVACLTPVCAQCCTARKEKKLAKKNAEERKKQEEQLQQQQQQNPQTYYDYSGQQQQQQQQAYGYGAPANNGYGAPPASNGYGAPPANNGYGAPPANYADPHSPYNYPSQPVYGQPVYNNPPPQTDTKPGKAKPEVDTPAPL